MTLGVSDLQSDSDMDSIRNSCDVFIPDYRPAQDHDDQAVRDKREDEDERHEPAVDRHHLGEHN